MLFYIKFKFINFIIMGLVVFDVEVREGLLLVKALKSVLLMAKSFNY